MGVTQRDPGCLNPHKCQKQGKQINPSNLQGDLLLHLFPDVYAEYIMRNGGLEEAQAGIKIAGRNTNNFRYVQMKSPLWQKVRRN